ncbi:hypothetical protein TWF696_009470 [Orbilia brochopaga]|uniref:Uncharacterized protein n=1 Tax=Orbilia brochopaga TaxID=3140254 RepID=A0AAV9UCY2_9PEZI
MSTHEFEIHANPSTDIWRKPPSTNDFNAPTVCLGNGALKSFQRARITFTLPRCSELNKYDQGGLLLHVKRPDVPHEQDQWIKTGVEFYMDQPWVGTVCCDRWADWSITPLEQSAQEGEYVTATVEVERSADELGRSLWIYAVYGEKRVPVREVAWLFAADEEDKQLVWLEVRAYACRPLKKEGKEEEQLVVKFLDFDVEFTPKKA